MNNITRNIIAIITGTITAFCLGAVLIYICAMSLNEEDGLAGILLFLFIGCFIPAFLGGAVCGYIANNKQYLNLIITSIALILILLINNDFKGIVLNLEVIVSAILTTTFVFLGGELGMVLKKRLAR